MINLFLLKHTPPNSMSEIILLMSYVIYSSHAYAYDSSTRLTYIHDLTSKLEAIMFHSNPVFQGRTLSRNGTGYCIGEESEKRALKEHAKFQTLCLKGDNEASLEIISGKIYQRLEEVKIFLLVLYDVWESIDLDDVGVPLPEGPSRSKVIITSRFSEEIARECGGLPLAITVIGTSMRGKTRFEVWKYTLDSFRRSEPNNKNEKDKIDDLLHCWWAEGILGEHDIYEQVYNRGITLIESLKDAFLFEADKMEIVDCVKMHDVVRDVARWIASTFGDEHTSVFPDGIGLTEISRIKLLTSVKGISFVSNEIECLPDCFPKCPDTTSLLLQDNEPLEKIPHKFFLAFPALRVLNLSETSIRELASSINSLCQQRSLILQSFFKLRELPPVANLHNLQVFDCEYTKFRSLPQGMENLTNLRLLNMLVPDLKSIGKGFFLKFPRIEMLNMSHGCLGATSFDEISSLHNLTYHSISV
ncbi:putative disease resistance protein-like [Capsicum annuum]|nr:putative disease resistance protein-like [Capsicum annuum]